MDTFLSVSKLLFSFLWPFILAWFAYIAFLSYRNIKTVKLAKKLRQAIANSKDFVKNWESISKQYWSEANNSHSLVKKPYEAAYRCVMTEAFLDRGLIPPESLVELPPKLPFPLRENEKPLFGCQAKTLVLKQYGSRTLKVKAGSDYVLVTTWGLHFMDGTEARAIPRRRFNLLQYRTMFLDVQGNRPESARYSLECEFGYEEVLYRALTTKIKELRN